jgi:subtilisin family serine protease
LDVANRLNTQESIIDFAQPDFIVIASDRVQSGMTSGSLPECIAPIVGIGPDPYFPEQWYLDHSAPGLAGDSDAHINAKAAWATTEGDNGIVVAVLDDAVETSHPDIDGTIYSTWNAFTGSNNLDITDQDKHGTPVAGIVGAVTGNPYGVKGTAPIVQLMPVRVVQWVQGVDGNNNPVWHAEYPYSVVADGIEFASEDAHILSMSLSLGQFDDWYHKEIVAAVDVALSKNRILVFAVGNDNLDYVVFPARMSATRPVIAVGATDDSDEIKQNTGGINDWGSNYGPEVTVVAPGVNIVAPDRTGANGYCDEDYTRFQGTSASTPVVAGVVALMQSQYMSNGAALLTPEALRTRLSETAHDLGPAGRDDYYGDGRVDACAALQEDTCGGRSR